MSSAGGYIFNIQRFSLHDGPGIRTTIFFKGCPLKCGWCQNPEGISSSISLFTYKNLCLNCKSCLEKCRDGAITLEESGPVIDRGLCTLCLECVASCPAEAIRAAGKYATVKELVEEVLKERVVFEESGGGVTISGGEPLMQPDFLIALLKALKSEQIQTAVETSGYAPWPILQAVDEWTDLFIYDLKLIDEDKSEVHTGVSSKIITRNLEALAESGSNIRVRMPVIPSVNVDQKTIQRTAEYLRKCGITDLELIPYHNLGTSKYEALDLEYRADCVEIPSARLISEVKAAFEDYDINIISEVE
jgi:pyruvate formate lyase activating enzyme